MDVLILFISLVLLSLRRIDLTLFSLILLTTSYLGAGTNVSTTFIVHNVSDTGLILYFVIFAYVLIKQKGQLYRIILGKYVVFFFIFLFISILVDLFVNHIDLLSIVKTSRHWLFLTCIWIFPYFSTQVYSKVVKYLLYASLVIALISILELFLDINVLGMRKVVELSNTGDFFIRGSLPSPLIFFFIFFLITDYIRIPKWLKYSSLLLLLSHVVLSVVRSWIFAVILGIILIIFLRQNFKIKSIIAGLLIIVSLVLMTLINTNIRKRFVGGIEEIQNLKLSNVEVKGNFTFRLLHVSERIKYVRENIIYSIFGIGNVTESNFPKYFYVGIKRDAGEIVQLDTGDIVWSTLFLRLGFAGTLIYLIFYFKTTFNVFHFRRYSTLAVILFTYLFLNIAILSFVSTVLSTGMFWLFPILTYYQITEDAN